MVVVVVVVVAVAVAEVVAVAVAEVIAIDHSATTTFAAIAGLGWPRFARNGEV